jgi:hypothetical protein
MQTSPQSGTASRKTSKAKQIALTNHARERMALRKISEAMISEAVNNPDQSKLEEDGDTKYIKKVGGRPLHVVAAFLADEDKWLVKTVFVRGEDDPAPARPFWQKLLKVAGMAALFLWRRRNKRR